MIFSGYIRSLGCTRITWWLTDHLYTFGISSRLFIVLFKNSCSKTINIGLFTHAIAQIIQVGIMAEETHPFDVGSFPEPLTWPRWCWQWPNDPSTGKRFDVASLSYGKVTRITQYTILRQKGYLEDIKLERCVVGLDHLHRVGALIWGGNSIF